MERLNFIYGEQLFTSDDLEPMAKAILSDHRISFSSSGMTLTEDTNWITPGLICKKEYVNKYYPIQRVIEILSMDRKMEVLVRLQEKEKEHTPSCEILYKLLISYSKYVLPPESFLDNLYLKADGIFLYGNPSLIQSYENHYIKNSKPFSAYLPGSLLEDDSDGQLIFRGENEIKGKFYLFGPDGASVINVLDEVFSFQGFGHPDNLFERTVVPVRLENEKYYKTWVYHGIL